MDNFYEIDKDKYLSHIKELDQLKNMNRVLDLISMVMKNYNIETTDFIDPYSARVAESILNRFSDIGYKIFGGFDESERKIVIIYPDYHYFTNKDSKLKVLRLVGDMSGLSHPDFLGSILALGIVRDKVGDILLGDTYTDIIVKSEIANYVSMNIKKIGNKNFKVIEKNFEDLEYKEPDFKEINSTMSSLRLDSYVSSAYNLSRKIGQNLIESGNVKVNFEPIEKTSFEVKEGDLISVRRYGRSKLFKINGISKKDRYKVVIRLLL